MRLAEHPLPPMHSNSLLHKTSMQIYQGEHLGTILNLKIDTSEPCDEVFLDIQKMIQNFENRFSRFILWNHLYNINKNSGGILDNDGVTMLQYALRVAHQSNGLFDPTILPYLRKIGYSAEGYQDCNQNTGYQYIELIGNRLTLHNNVEIEFWWIGKGYLIDSLAQHLRDQNYEHFLIDFWWDIWAEWSWEVWLEHPISTDEIIDIITLTDTALAASSGSKRSFGSYHHIIDPRIGISQWSPRASFVLATSAMIADVHATLFCIMDKREWEVYLGKYGENMDVKIIGTN